jgi:hypothetical protein
MERVGHAFMMVVEIVDAWLTLKGRKLVIQSSSPCTLLHRLFSLMSQILYSMFNSYLGCVN